MAELIPSPSLKIPTSDSVVRVRAIDTTANMCVSAQGFVKPVMEGFDNLNLTTMAFLIENDALGKKILFDCGARKDFENLAPCVKRRLNTLVQGLKVEKDVNEIIEEAGIDLKTLNSMIWSHWHWDHHGAAEKYPTSVEIVVGPGFKKSFMPGWPTNPDAPLLDADFANREVREIAFKNEFKLGNFLAHDFFGDGSFYLLDTPGHAIGHMCGFARTTPTTFVFMGGDICHFSGSYRPSVTSLLPDPVPNEQLDPYFPSPCPCAIFTALHPAGGASDKSRATPFFQVSTHEHSAYSDPVAATESITAMQQFDGNHDVLVCIAHDPALLKVLPLLNNEPEKDINDWKERGYKERVQWRWLNDLPRDGNPAKPMLVDGVWREGRLVPDFTKL